MAVSEEECSSAKSRSSSSASSSSSHYLAKCVLRGSVVLQVLYGHIRFPTSYDVVFGKETSIELVIIGEDGIVQSICEQPVFGTIKDIAILPSNDKFRTQNPQMLGKDLLVVISDSGNLSFLSFCNEMHRFFPVTHVQLSNPGNSRNQLGRMLAIDSSGCFIAASAYENQLAMFSVSVSGGSDIIDKKIVFPPEKEADASAARVQKNSICGTIWSMSFISKDPSQSSKGHNPVLAVLLNRREAVLNELLLLGWNISEQEIYVISTYTEDGPLAHSIVEVPHSYGFAFMFREGDALLMDLRDAQIPYCVYRTSPNFLSNVVDEANFVQESSRGCDLSRVLQVDDEGGLFNVAACALLELSDLDPMCIDGDKYSVNVTYKHVCSWSWEPGNAKNPRMIICADTGEYFMIEIIFGPDGLKVQESECLYKGLPCKAVLWVEGGFLAAIVEMGDGMVLKMENGALHYASPIQNIAPVLDMSVVDYHDEKHDQMFACCGVAPEGSLRIIRSGISVEKLLRTAPIYQGITVGFQPDVSTLACGIVNDGLLVQIHKSAVRLCLPTKAAHSEGTPLPSPVCTSWFPENMSISLGAVGHNLIVVSSSNPCFLIILGVRLLLGHHYEIYEMQHLRLQNELSCVSIPLKRFEGTSLVDNSCAATLPFGVDISNIFVIGTHKPSVEVLSLVPNEGLRVLASGTISLTNTLGTAISGCIPQDVRLVLVDRLYVLSGLRNGMLLRFEWPASQQCLVVLFHDRPWLLHTARHSLSYTSISFQSSTHVTPVCYVECPKGILFVAENCLHLVEMVHSKRLNVQKFHLGGTPREVLYHSESRLLLVMRTDLSNDTSSSDICCVILLVGQCCHLSNLNPVKQGNPWTIMPSGEAESTKGRLIVLCLEHVQNSDSGSMTLCSKAGSSSQRASPFHEIVGYATEQLSSSSLCSSPDDTSCDGIKLEETEAWQFRLAYVTKWPGMVLAICPYLDRYFLASSGNAFYVCGFPNDNSQRVRKFAWARTRFMITSLTAHFTTIAVGDCRDGVLFYAYHEDSKKLQQLYFDPCQRLVADCILMDVNTAVVSDRKGSIAVLSCADYLEDTASPECNLTVSCAYYMGEIAMSIRKGSFSYKLPADDVLKGSDGNIDFSQNAIIVSTLLGSIITFVPISREEYELLEAVQDRLVVHPLTAPILGNDHNEYRSRENPVGVPKILDGDMLSQFLELTGMQQEAVLSSPLGAQGTVKPSLKSRYALIPVNQVVQLLERVHYALN
ncbi:splicing factor 3B subunit 3 [Prunus yedoensis var. nudiflora]|uniref:Splicing factor 3B subunit 3 n=1 Tax=Prunus yedoensis var. nudiflora TaxID=2094558 RepID=A0A314ZV15_PRUYE|nr:splicing factor 3B subunit 3 [Prunus yedoensis var. nudiflora]